MSERSDIGRGAPTTTRRAMVLGAGGAGLAAVLTACSGYGEPSGAVVDDKATGEPQPSAPEETAGDDGSAGFAKTSDIPEGGGKIFESEKVVVTQPSAGEFKAFSTTCTHQGCPVKSVSNGTINCPCHGSKFKIADGSVDNGPATDPLPEVKISVDGDAISLA
ncbi:Rieske (2Fe-2S) protein [Streptosporangium sp. KLBMP 9127]|nr:Rieske (2Fe-2S) protein [Streptosporangium sp. KLBMP 9127]